MRRLRSWLITTLAALRSALAHYRVNSRAAFFAVACWLVWSGVHDWSPRTAKIALGSILLFALFRAEKPAQPSIGADSKRYPR